MIKLNIRKAVTFSLVTACLFSLTPMKTNAAWKKDTTGWWYTVNNSYSRGWKEIDGKWYYFYSNGYMAHDTIIGGYKLGSDGAWITNTLNNSNKSTESKITEVTVGNAQEFVNSIGSNKKSY
ncbi:cell wall-binding protein [Clostridium neonatale]|uniref:cell wall-binding protein n=1 Tax=Clostridium neonatale TaxID=137838 RepID=UPI0031403366